MMTFLDLLVIVFMAIATLGLLSISLMFLVRNKRVKQISFYAASIVSLYLCTVGIRMFWPMFPGQFAFGLLLGLMSIIGLILSFTGRSDEKKQKIARILASVSLVLGTANVFLI